jgi:hypothetical protein
MSLNLYLENLIKLIGDNSMKVLFVITARGGSKSVPMKNIKKVPGGVSLSWHTRL